MNKPRFNEDYVKGLKSWMDKQEINQYTHISDDFVIKIDNPKVDKDSLMSAFPPWLWGVAIALLLIGKIIDVKRLMFFSGDGSLIILFSVIGIIYTSSLISDIVKSIYSGVKKERSVRVKTHDKKDNYYDSNVREYQ